MFTAPAADYPLEILRVGIAWGSRSGGAPSSLEESIQIYENGLPDPGVPIFGLEGPVLNDGAINQFDLEPFPGRILVESGPFAVTLEFLDERAPRAPSPLAGWRRAVAQNRVITRSSAPSKGCTS